MVPLQEVMKTLQRCSGREIAFSQRSECHGANSLVVQLYFPAGWRSKGAHIVHRCHSGELRVQRSLHSKSRGSRARKCETVCGCWHNDLLMRCAIGLDVL
jgi:hypothetical protein